MYWKFLFGILFILFVVLTITYAGKSLVVYNKVTIESVVDKKLKEEDGKVSTYSHPQQVTRTYQDNYAAIGGAIGLAILGAASLIGFALLVRQEKH